MMSKALELSSVSVNKREAVEQPSDNKIDSVILHKERDFFSGTKIMANAQFSVA